MNFEFRAGILNESHSSLPVVSSKDMAFSAGTAEGQQFVFEKGQTNMTSQLAMASSSLLVKQKTPGPVRWSKIQQVPVQGALVRMFL